MKRSDFDRARPIWISTFGRLLIARQGCKVALAVVDEHQDTILLEPTRADHLKIQRGRYRSWTKRNARVRAARAKADAP